jgi:hypothetical protein
MLAERLKFWNPCWSDDHCIALQHKAAPPIACCQDVRGAEHMHGLSMPSLTRRIALMASKSLPRLAEVNIQVVEA